MDAITGAFERLAILLKPLGVVLGTIAGILFIGAFMNFGTLPSDTSWLMTLGMLWSAGLAMLIYWFKPGKSEFAEAALPSAARRYGKPMQLYVTIFFLFWFAFVSLITVVHLRNVG